MADDAGGKLAGRIAEILGEAMVNASAATADGHHATRIAHTSAFMETIEGDLTPFCRAAFQDIAEHPDTPPELAAFYRQTYDPQHQSDVILQILALFGLAFAAPFAAAAGKLQAIKNMSMEAQHSTPLDPQTAAGLAGRRIVDPGFAAQEASYNGLASNRAAALYRGSQSGPGPETVLRLLREGRIGGGQAADGLMDAGLRDEWLGPLIAANKGPLPAGTAVSAAVESHIDAGHLAALLEANGIDGAYADLWLETAGRPPGVVELGALVNRGVMSLGDWQQAVRESDIKNKYVPALTALLRHYPPQRSIVAMIRSGAIDPDTGATWMAYDGLHPDAIGAMVKEALNGKHEKVRDLTQAQIIGMYGDHEIDTGVASQHLSALGYDSTEVQMLLAHADFTREHALQVEAAKRVQRRVVAGLVDDAEARQELAAIGVDGAQADLWLRYWDLERDQQARTLTPAQVEAAAKKGFIDETEFRKRLGVYGYPPRDLDLLWMLATGNPPGTAVQ